jgi:hypothetical protein
LPHRTHRDTPILQTDKYEESFQPLWWTRWGCRSSWSHQSQWFGGRKGHHSHQATQWRGSWENRVSFFICSVYITNVS